MTVAVGDPGNAVDSTHRITLESTPVIASFKPTTSNKISTITSRIRVSDGRLTVDAAGGTNTKLLYIDIVPVAGTAGVGATLARINFQSAGAPVPYGYAADSGAAYAASRGYGWISQTTSTPVSITGKGVDRNATPDQRLDTLIQMQVSPARWEYAVPNGTYDVRVGVGDASVTTGSNHQIAVESETAVNGFTPSASDRFNIATVRVDVTDGKITLDAAGGTNTKLVFVDIHDANNAARTIISVDPSNGAVGVPTTTSVNLAPSHAIEQTTMTAATVKLLRPDGSQVPGNYNSDAAGGIISFTPLEPAGDVHHLPGAHDRRPEGPRRRAVRPVRIEFTTGESTLPPPPVNFTRSTLADIDGPTTIVNFQDKYLFVGTALGQIYRYPIGTAAARSAARRSSSRHSASTNAPSPAWSSSPARRSPTSASGCPTARSATATWPTTPARSRVLSGSTLNVVQDKITQLPRSVRDHMNNGIVFGPDGKLYIAQGSLSGFGGPDPNWGFRAETPMSASILVADVVNDSSLRRVVVGQREHVDRLQPERLERPGEDLRRGTAQPLRPRVAPERLAVHGGERVGRGQHPGRPEQQPDCPERPPGRSGLPRPDRGRQVLRPPEPEPGPLRAQRGQPDRGGRSVRDAAVPASARSRTRSTSARSWTSACTARPTASTSTSRTPSAR